MARPRGSSRPPAATALYLIAIGSMLTVAMLLGSARPTPALWALIMLPAAFFAAGSLVARNAQRR
jgi:hypothetical protein